MNTTTFRPFTTQFIPDRLDFQPSDRRVRWLSEMAGLYADEQAYNDLLTRGDRILYEMLVTPTPEETGHLLHSVTVMYPGRVGNEFFMTSGHFHLDLNASEVYYCLAGQGVLLVMDQEGACEALPMAPGTTAYIPPGWAHRTANTGETPFVFLAVWPGDAGHDYGKIKQIGFSRLVVQGEGTYQLIDNPKFHKV